MKALFEFLKLPLSLPVPFWLELVIIGIIGEIAFRVAYTIAGTLGQSASERKEIHWIIRIPIYITLWLLACVIIKIIEFAKKQTVLFIFTVSAIIVLVITITVIIIIHKAKKKKDKENNQNNENKKQPLESSQ